MRRDGDLDLVGQLEPVAALEVLLGQEHLDVALEFASLGLGQRSVERAFRSMMAKNSGGKGAERIRCRRRRWKKPNTRESCGAGRFGGRSIRRSPCSSEPPDLLPQPALDAPEPVETIVFGAAGVFPFAPPHPLITRTARQAPVELIGDPTERLLSACRTRRFVLAGPRRRAQDADGDAGLHVNVEPRDQIARQAADMARTRPPHPGRPRARGSVCSTEGTGEGQGSASR